MKEKYVAFLIIVFLAMGLFSCSNNNAVEGNIKFIQEKSWFNYFSVSNNTAYMECYLAVENLRDEDVNVKINATSEEDVSGGLLKSAYMTGFNKNLSSDTFTLSSGENDITVIFTGEFGGKLQKQDRLLPENINFEIINKF